MPAYVLFSLATAVTIAISLLANKFILKGASYTLWFHTFWFHFLHGMWAIVLFLLFPTSIEKIIIAVPYAVLSALFWVGGNTILFYALHKIDASTVGSLLPLKLLFVPFIAYLFLGELFPFSVYLWFIPLIIGGFLVTLDEHIHIKTFFRTEVGVMFIGLLLFVLTDIFLKKGADAIGSFQYFPVFFGCVTLVSLGFLPFVKKPSIMFSQIRIFSVLSFLTVLINIFFVLALRNNVTLTNAIAMLNAPFLLLITFILSRFKPELLEKHPPRVYVIRAIGSLIMYGAAVAIVMQ